MLFDLQINGALGIGFTSDALTTDQIRSVSDELARHRISGFCATVITSSFAVQEASFKALARARLEDVLLTERMPAFHLEGPWLSPDDGPRGAHPKEYIREPNWDEFRRLQDAAEGFIKLVTLAPEQPGALAFIGKLCTSGVVVAIGHTAASPAQIRDAVSAGARLSTHLGNGSHAMLPRHDNYLWEQLACDGLHASVIADGHHLPDALLKVIARVKRPEQLILTCDASPLAGLPAGCYKHWGAELEVSEAGRIGVAGTPFLAGSGAFLDECVEHFARVTGLPLETVLPMASANPRKLLGLPPVAVDLAVWQALPLARTSVSELKL